MGIGVEVSREEIVGIEGVSTCGIKECWDVEVVWSPDEVKRKSEVGRGIEIGASYGTKYIPLVAERIWDKPILEKEYWENEE